MVSGLPRSCTWKIPEIVPGVWPGIRYMVTFLPPSVIFVPFARRQVRPSAEPLIQRLKFKRDHHQGRQGDSQARRAPVVSDRILSGQRTLTNRPRGVQDLAS